MKSGKITSLLLLAPFALSLVGCSIASAFSPTATPSPTLTSTPAPTETPLPTTTPTATPTATQIPFFLDAKVWTGDLQVPILLYHRFVPDSTPQSTSTKTRLADFKNQLQLLYDSGFSLVSLQSWLDGDFVVPTGRKPLILTLDDGWFADQLYINDDGTPSVYSGLGILWYFSQEHPDFGYTAAIFDNMGDKYYGDKLVGDRFFLGDGDAWKDKLGKTIAWAIDHGIEPYNHTYTHVQLDKTKNSDIVYQLKQNDLVLRTFLDRVGRSDLDKQLGNMIALPFGIWPATQSGIDILKNYKNPEGLKTEAIMEAYNLNEAVFTPSVFSPNFTPYNIPRLTAGNAMINLVVQDKEKFPVAQDCKLGPLDESRQDDPVLVASLIESAISTGKCPAGVYNVSGNVYDARGAKISLYYTKSATPTSEAVSVTPTPTP